MLNVSQSLAFFSVALLIVCVSFCSADSLLSGGTDVDMTERACSEHISDQVNLKWTLTGTETSGVTSLRGISLSSTMLGLITVAPLQWGEYENDSDSLEKI